jgi:hypothetical protein
MIATALALAVVVALQVPPPLPPQRPPPGGKAAPRPPEVIALKGPLRVFLDCQYECDTEFIRKELTFVDHVRDSQSADVHALITTESTGGGGLTWKIEFIGQGRFAGHDETLTFTTAQTDSGDIRRRALLRWLKLGLATHAAVAVGKADIDVTHTAKPAAETAAQRDPWNAWVFSLNTNGNFSGEATSNSSSFRFNTTASRVTAEWKFSINGNWNRNRSTFDVSETETVKSHTSSWNSSALAVKSLGPKWSAAARAAFSGSTFSNYDQTARLMAGMEYDFFPYAESTRRSLTVSYLLGVAHYDFKEITIFDRLNDTGMEHLLGASLGLRQPWGSLGLQSTFAQQLDDLSKNRFNVYGDADVRLFKGFSFNVYGEYSRIRDQINLRKGAASEEEVLLRQRQLATGFQYWAGFGVTYRFGSIYNNVVNPRFRNF